MYIISFKSQDNPIGWLPFLSHVTDGETERR